jgi:hypothetical protein
MDDDGRAGGAEQSAPPVGGAFWNVWSCGQRGREMVDYTPFNFRHDAMLGPRTLFTRGIAGLCCCFLVSALPVVHAADPSMVGLPFVDESIQ